MIQPKGFKSKVHFDYGIVWMVYLRPFQMYEMDEMEWKWINGIDEMV